MKYHGLKMEEVNDTMKHLWNKTYQGTDIDGIKIKSDVEGGASKRSYNYRVSSTPLILLVQCRTEVFVLFCPTGGHDERPSRDGHARSLFSRSKDAREHHHPISTLRFLWSELRYSGTGRAYKRVGYGECGGVGCESCRVSLSLWWLVGC